MPRSRPAKNPLAKERRRGWREELLTAATELPRRLRPAAYACLGLDSRGEEIPSAAQRTLAREAAAGLLDEATARDRQRVFEALLPEVAEYVAGGWRLGLRLPYQRGGEGRVFRAPRHPAVSRRARGDWLAQLVGLLAGYRRGVVWIAARAPEIDGFAEGDVLAVLFAAAIDAGGRDGKKVFDVLRSVLREGEQKGVARPHAGRALLLAERSDGWEQVEEFLGATNDPEVRRLILEGAGEAHAEAFRRLLDSVRGHDLGRFAEVVQVLNGWLGYAWGAVSARVVNGVLDRLLAFLEDRAARSRALAADEGETVYLALWAQAFDDAVAAVKSAGRLLRDASVERRFAAVHLLGQLDLPEARRPLRSALDDPDLRVALRALEGFTHEPDEEDRRGEDLFEPLERLLKRMPPRRTPLDPIIWPWHVLTADAQQVAGDLIGHLGRRPAARLLAHLPRMDVDRRAQVVQRAAGVKKRRS